MTDEKKKDEPGLHVVDPEKPKANGGAEEKQYETVGIPLLKEEFATLFDNHDSPTVMIFTIPIRSIALSKGKGGLAMLLGNIELLKGEANRLYKGIRAEEATKTSLIKPAGIHMPPQGRA